MESVNDMWFLLQLAIVFAVMETDIRWQWTPSGGVVVLLGYVLAYVVTCLLVSLLDAYKRYQAGKHRRGFRIKLLNDLLMQLSRDVRGQWRVRPHQRIEGGNGPVHRQLDDFSGDRSGG
jgi:hypothetical protein